MFGKNLLRVVLLSVAMAAMSMAQASSQASHTSSPASHTGDREKGSYYPLAVGNWWLYTVKESSRKKTTTYKWWVSRNEEATFGPRAYQLSETPVTADTPTFLAARENGIVDPETDHVEVKSPLHTGDRWGNPAYEAVSAGKACVVGGHHFHDCATVHEFSPGYHPSGLVRAVTYARGVGPVEYAYFNEHDPKKIDSTLTIRSWHVKSGGNE